MASQSEVIQKKIIFVTVRGKQYKFTETIELIKMIDTVDLTKENEKDEVIDLTEEITPEKTSASDTSPMQGNTTPYIGNLTPTYAQSPQYNAPRTPLYFSPSGSPNYFE